MTTTKNRLLASDGPLDTLSALCCTVYSTVFVLAYGLGVGPAQKLMPDLMSAFGILGDGVNDAMGSTDGWIATIGGAYALGSLFSLVPFFMGTENPVGRHHRQVQHFYTWVALAVCIGQAGVSKGKLLEDPVYGVWVGLSAAMAGVHWTWVNHDVLHKWKLE